MYIILRWIINALVLMLIPVVVAGVEIKNLSTALIAALFLALLNATIRPFLLLLTLPINILTLGLLTFVINAFMFWILGYVIKGVEVIGFWPAFWAALIFSIISMFLNWLLD